MTALMDKRIAEGTFPGQDGLYADERELLGYANAFLDLGPDAVLITQDEAMVLVEALAALGRFRNRRIEDLISTVRDEVNTSW